MDEIRAEAAKWTPEVVADVTGVSVETLMKLQPYMRELSWYASLGDGINPTHHWYRQYTYCSNLYKWRLVTCGRGDLVAGHGVHGRIYPHARL